MRPNEASKCDDTIALRERAIERASSLMKQLEKDQADLLRAQQLRGSDDLQRGVDAVSNLIEAARLVRERLQGG